ncbi:MAG: hypothetical protein AB7K24_12625 [Gemmataceae bacterium]
MLRTFLWQTAQYQRWQQRAWDHLFNNQLRNTERIGRELLEVARTAEQIIPKIRLLVERSRAEGQDLEHAGAFEEAAHTIDILSQRMAKWPFHNLPDIAAGRTAYLDGNCAPVEDLIRELQDAGDSQG